MITSKGMNSIANAILNLFDKAVVTADGVEYEYEIYSKEVKEDKLVVTIYIQDEFYGNISEKAIVDKEGNKLLVNDINIDKSEDGLYVRFGIKLKEVLE